MTPEMLQKLKEAWKLLVEINKEYDSFVFEGAILELTDMIQDETSTEEGTV